MSKVNIKEHRKETVLNLIRQAGIYEYGIADGNLAEKLAKIQTVKCPHGMSKMVAGALSNNDFSHMLLQIIREMPEKVLTGLEAIGYILDAKQLLLYLPDNEKELGGSLLASAKEQGIIVEIRYGIADTRLLRDGCICHIETLAAVSDAIHGQYMPRTLISVEKWQNSEKQEILVKPMWVSFGQRVCEILDLNGQDIKVIQIGDQLYDVEALDMEITPQLALGDGVIKVYGKECCMVHMAEKKLLSSRHNSCGKCTFCREGLNQLYSRMHEITSGKGDWDGLEIMTDIGKAMQFSCSCSIGNTGSTFTLETIKQFKDEYFDHIKKKKCTVGSCLAFINVYIDPTKCIGCGECLKCCPMDCLEGMPGYIHMIEDMDCNKCGKCMEVCEEGAIIKTTDRMLAIPDRLTRVGRFKRY